MGSPLGCLLADIFMSHIEAEVEDIINPTLLYKRYVDDILIPISSSKHAQVVLERLNGTHPNTSLTCEGEENSTLDFLDVQAKRTDGRNAQSVGLQEIYLDRPIYSVSMFLPIILQKGFGPNFVL